MVGDAGHPVVEINAGNGEGAMLVVEINVQRIGIVGKREGIGAFFFAICANDGVVSK